MKDLIWQNVTEGPLTDELKAADMILLSEGSPWHTRRGRKPHKHKLIRSRRIKGVLISVKRDEFKVVDSGHRMFHRSGKAEGWDGIRTPARGVVWVIGYWYDDPRKELQLYWVSHWLNSWMPAGKPDRWTAQRHRIVTKTTIPVVEDLVADKMDRHDVKGGLGGGDTNSLPWDGDLDGMFHVHNRGLDRVWRFGRAKAEYVGSTPKTGRGPQMQHHGEKVQQDIMPRKVEK